MQCHLSPPETRVLLELIVVHEITSVNVIKGPRPNITANLNSHKTSHHTVIP